MSYLPLVSDLGHLQIHCNGRKLDFLLLSTQQNHTSSTAFQQFPSLSCHSIDGVDCRSSVAATVGLAKRWLVDVQSCLLFCCFDVVMMIACCFHMNSWMSFFHAEKK